MFSCRKSTTILPNTQDILRFYLHKCKKSSTFAAILVKKDYGKTLFGSIE